MSEENSIQPGYLENLSTPILTINKDFGIQCMNKSGADLVGINQKDLIGKKCYELLKTGHCNTEHCVSAIAMKNNRKVTDETDSHTSNKNLPIMNTGAPVKDKTCKVIGALEFIADISKIKVIQNYLADSTKSIRKDCSRLMVMNKMFFL